ncbi:MAG: Gfo/Idh/MocA family oxidoreductase [Candidatus Margulisbacteria bacterium]|nr:Gfo/Idh/MocA family oxidoreductase [Candidatus Margulisiibacteriota bacterium]
MKKGRGLKFGIIGLGKMGNFHAKKLMEIPGAKPYAVFDVREEQLNKAAQEYGAKTFTNYNDLLKEVDAVIVTAPTEKHFEIASATLAAGKPTLVEKPLAKTSADAEKLVALAKEKNTILSAGHIERFNPAFQGILKLIRKERVLGIDIKRTSPFPERITDANVVQDMMIHDLDIALNLLPLDEIESLTAKGKKVKSKVFDIAIAKLYFKSGIITKIEANRVSDSTQRKIVVSTEKGVVEADLLKKTIIVRDFQHPSPSVHHIKVYDQLEAELTDFVKAIKNNLSPTVTGEDGLAAVKLAEEVEKACS